jgi:PAS domain S-box-containing protein
MRPALIRYGLAILIAGFTVGVALLLSYLSISINMTLLVVASLVITAWYGGRGPGILVAVIFEIVTLASNRIPEDMSIPRWAFSQFSVFALLIFIVWLISGRRLTERRLRRQGELFQTTLASIGDAVISTDSEGRITFINPTAGSVLGLEDEAALGKPLGGFLNVTDADGKRIGDLFGKVKEHRETVAFAEDLMLARNDGISVPIILNGSPILDNDGEFEGTVFVFQDMTPRHEAERALMESENRLKQAQKMEAIGTLTGGIAHDFNNLLTAIIGYTQIALRRVTPDDPIRGNLVEVEKAGSRAASLTGKLLAFSRHQVLDRRVIDLNDAVREMLKLMERVIGAEIQISFKAAESLDHVYADPAQVEQVVMNLSLNARDAMPTGGRLAIETRMIELDEYYARQYPNCKPGRYAQLLVSDTGTGMDTATMERIFEPFFTTKEVNKGTGLGLSMVYGIVKQHGGHINVYSEPGRGTTFKIFLPAVEQEVTEDTGREGYATVGGTETILVADDEEALRNLSCDVLEALGYRVLLAENGEQAVEIFNRNADDIDLLLLDVVMPLMGGSEAYQIIKKTAGRSVPLIFMTGYSEEVLESRYVKQSGNLDLAGVTVLQKPYTLETLGRTVRSVLDKNNHE